jgi:hypothetical protein
MGTTGIEPVPTACNISLRAAYLRSQVLNPYYLKTFYAGGRGVSRSLPLLSRIYPQSCSTILFVPDRDGSQLATVACFAAGGEVRSLAHPG